jgi:hypothetical protein
MDSGDMRLVLAFVKTQSWRTSRDLSFRKLIGILVLQSAELLSYMLPL